MINVIEMYYQSVIKPLEKITYETKKKSKKATFLKPLYNNYVKKYERLLYEDYIEFAKIIEQEFDSYKK